MDTMNGQACTDEISIRADDRIGDVVTIYPGLELYFEALGITCCCDRAFSIREAADSCGLDVDRIIGSLNGGAEHVRRPGIPGSAPTGGTAELIDHISGTHHTFAARTLPRLRRLAERVSFAHSTKDGRLPGIARNVAGVADSLLVHIAEQETVLFPILRDGTTSTAGNEAIRRQAVERISSDHEVIGRMLEYLLELTDGCEVPEWACGPYRQMLYTLQELVHDTYRHLELEQSALVAGIHDAAGRGHVPGRA